MEPPEIERLIKILLRISLQNRADVEVLQVVLAGVGSPILLEGALARAQDRYNRALALIEQGDLDAFDQVF
jgi:hypothetical protein